MIEALSDYSKKMYNERIEKMREDELRCYYLAKKIGQGRCMDREEFLECESLQSYISIVNVG